ncbi:MAG: hypothetical protein IJZ56_02020 [Oscillospiraceae bacterium]|nr:hypothetical protein [Oscillospiraceae bacterium]
MHPDRKHIYEAVIKRMVTESLAEKEKQFAVEHAEDTDGQLIAYLRKCTMELQHSPHPKEIVGWQYILERFGTWEGALRRARIPRPYTPNTPSKFQLVVDEIALQQEIYRKKKAEKKQLSNQRRQQQENKKKTKSTV